MKKLILSLVFTLFSLAIVANAAISVGPGGSGTLTFDTLPAAGDWSTLTNGGAGTDITDATMLDAAVQTNVASVINQAVGSTGTTAPAISSANFARWNSTLLAVQTVATGPAYISLLATLQNNTGNDQSALTLSYDLTENHATGGTNPNAVVEEVPGHRVYFSLTGAAGSWQVIPEISSIGTSGTLVGTANLGSWTSGSLLYLLWADDNAAADRNNTNNEEGGYLIDNVTFKAGTITGSIPVGVAGSGTITFGAYPNVLEGWYTLGAGTSSADIIDATTMDLAVQTNSAAAFTKQLGNSATVAPSISSSSIARWNYTLNAIETVPTGVSYIALLAKLRNDSGSSQTQLTLTYDLAELSAIGTTVTEEVPGHRVYWSLTGSPASWMVIPEVSSVSTPGTLVATLNLGAWAAGTPLYILWADDNATANRDNATLEEGGYTIDNISFTPGTVTGTRITNPTNNAIFPEGVPITIDAVAILPATVTVVDFYSDGILIGTDSTSPYSVVYSNAPVGGHNLTAVASDLLGNMSTSPTVHITVIPNNPPTATLTEPANGATFFVGVNVTNRATASDTDGSVARMEFYVDGGLFFTDNTSPYSFELCDITEGPHTISAVAVDNAGYRGTNTVSITATNPPGITTLVVNGSSWKYLDNGSDQGTAWRMPGFDDSTWNSGAAELGYGDATGNNRPEKTVLSFGPDANAKYPTTYFRKTFTVADPSVFGGLVIRLLRDDSGIVYLNGTEVFRSGLTNEAVDYLTYTQPGITDDGTIYQVTNINTSVLIAGVNTVAVEIHQDAANSSDISFDLMIWGTAPAGPSLTITYDPGTGNATITWSGGGTLITTDDPTTPRTSWSPVAGATSPYVTAATDAHRFYAVRVP